MIHEVKMYTISCDNCGEQYVSHTDFSAWYDSDDAVDSAVNMDDWHCTEEGKHYCPNCFEIDDNDQFYTKSETMKAIEYRGQNDFYLFDKPDKNKYIVRNLTGSSTDMKAYNIDLKANLSAGKKIINPEVILTNDYTGSRWFLVTGNSISGPDYQELKPGDIFPISDNIGFEEKLQLIRDKQGFEQYVDVIRLFLKDKPKPYTLKRPSEHGDAVIVTEMEGSPVESQDEIWNEVASNFRRFYEEHAIEESKSKFTITRKP